MTPETSLNALKLLVKDSIRYGDFLLGNNRFSNTWIYTGTWNTEEGRQCIREILAGFCTAYIQSHNKKYVLVDIEYPDQSSENGLSPEIIAQEAVRLVKNPSLSFDKIFIDPDSFELYMKQWPKDREIIIFIDLSVNLDLLISVCSNLQALGCHVTSIITVVERANIQNSKLRESLRLDLIPFIVYNEPEDNVYSILELNKPPYTAYHTYFS